MKVLPPLERRPDCPERVSELADDGSDLPEGLPQFPEHVADRPERVFVSADDMFAVPDKRSELPDDVSDSPDRPAGFP